MKRKVKVVVALLLVVSLGLAGCGSSSKKKQEEAKKKTLDGSKYVLIYNPLIFDEVEVANNGGDTSSARTNLSTGNLSSQIVVNPNKAGDLKTKPKIKSIPQKNPIEITKGKKVKSKAKSKAGTLVKSYSVGDKEEFFYGLDTKRPKANFDCMYAGTHCYVWGVNGSIDAQTANACGREFDEKIFNNDTNSFGVGRFVEQGGKLNILCYPMSENGLGGFFSQGDLFTKEEATALLAEAGATPEELGLNTDRAIVNINSRVIAQEPDMVYSVIAHEYQHLVCASSCMNLMLTNSNVIRKWLNEAMSGIAEEINYQGAKTKDGTIPEYVVSQSQRRGQSLYNFKVDNSATNFDIGAYANVYEFAKYLKDNNDESVFSRIHSKAKEEGNTAMENFTESKVTEADLLAQAVSSDFKNKIDKSYSFDSNVSNAIGNQNEVWMSKLTLNYYLNLLQEKFDFSPNSITYPDSALLYDTMENGNIEGGGRILVKVSGDKFEIPQDADDNLIYIGLDKDFKPITEAITKKTK